MRAARSRALALACAATCIALAGCTSLATRITEPRTDSAMSARLRASFDHSFAQLGVRTGSVDARGGNRIVYRSVPAADYHFEYVTKRTGGNFSFKFSLNPETPPTPKPPVGTIVLLHGWEDDHSTMMLWALAMAKYGYLGIVPDLRNHGASDRAPAGFGTREALDIVDLLASLRARGALHEPVYLFGVSYGATTAVFADADPRADVQAVIAMEPFVNAGAAVRSVIASLRNVQAGTLKARLLRFLARHRYSARRVNHAIADADARLGLDLDAIDIGPVLRDGGDCTLVLHGGKDAFLDPARVRALADAPNVHYFEVPEENHFTLPARIDLLAGPLANWLRAADRCPDFALPQTASQP